MFVVSCLTSLLFLFGFYLDPLLSLLIFGKSTLGSYPLICVFLPKISYIVLYVLILHSFVCMMSMLHTIGCNRYRSITVKTEYRVLLYG